MTDANGSLTYVAEVSDSVENMSMTWSKVAGSAYAGLMMHSWE